MIISAGISERTGIPLEKLIKRNASSGRREQKSLSREERRENVRGAFSLAGDVKGKRVLLFDDIVTTGASAAEGTRVLIEGGAAGVCVICLFSKL